MSISHWWVIALTTGGTVSFLVAKVLKYEVRVNYSYCFSKSSKTFISV